MEIQSKQLDLNLCQFAVIFCPTTTKKEYLDARPRVLKIVILKLNTVLVRLRSSGFHTPEALHRFGEVLQYLGHEMKTRKDVIEAFSSEIENLRKIDLNDPTADLERAIKFCNRMSGVFSLLQIDPVARLRVVKSN